MNRDGASNRSGGKWRLLFSLPAFALGFFISFHQDQTRISQMGQLAWAHFNYAFALKDDMAVIDWSQNLERLEGVLAFQVREGAQVLAEGGNLRLLPARARPGATFIPPRRWVVAQGSTSNASPREFILVHDFFPGPLIWGFFGSAVSLFSLWVGGWRRPLPFGQDNKLNEDKEPARISPSRPSPVRPALEMDQSQGPHLFIDKHYLIQQITPEAAGLLQKPSALLLQSHLFDLNPDSSLMAAVERKEEVKLLTPFLSLPQLSVWVKPDPRGTLLFLESLEAPQTTQKH